MNIFFFIMVDKVEKCSCLLKHVYLIKSNYFSVKILFSIFEDWSNIYFFFNRISLYLGQNNILVYFIIFFHFIPIIVWYRLLECIMVSKNLYFLLIKGISKYWFRYPSVPIISVFYTKMYFWINTGKILFMY